MTAIRTQLAPIAELEQILPKLLSNLSLARAQIAIDQIRATIATNSLDNLLFVTACSPDSPESPLAAAIAVQQSTSDREGSDMATLIHAGWLTQSENDQKGETIAELSAALDCALRDRGIRFLQWATDDDKIAGDSVSRWCQGLSMEPIGTLDYLGGDVPEQSDSASPAPGGDRLTFTPVDWDQPDAFDQFVNLVEATYAETLDCPRLAHYRTAAQTLRGYQTSSAFDSGLWYLASSGEEVAGCMVLGNHQPLPPPSDNAETDNAETDNANEASAVIEIVYMGLVPQARGRRRGMQFMQRAFEAGREIGANRIILAVDQKNHPAREIYDVAGLGTMLSETVWVKLLDSERSGTT